MAYIDQVTFAGVEFSNCTELYHVANYADPFHYFGKQPHCTRKNAKMPLWSLGGLILYLIILYEVVSQELSL